MKRKARARPLRGFLFRSPSAPSPPLPRPWRPGQRRRGRLCWWYCAAPPSPHPPRHQAPRPARSRTHGHHRRRLCLALDLKAAAPLPPRRAALAPGLATAAGLLPKVAPFRFSPPSPQGYLHQGHISLILAARCAFLPPSYAHETMPVCTLCQGIRTCSAQSHFLRRAGSSATWSSPPSTSTRHSFPKMKTLGSTPAARCARNFVNK